jgi:hypothetical protein
MRHEDRKAAGAELIGRRFEAPIESEERRF